MGERFGGANDINTGKNRDKICPNIRAPAPLGANETDNNLIGVVILNVTPEPMYVFICLLPAIISGYFTYRAFTAVEKE